MKYFINLPEIEIEPHTQVFEINLIYKLNKLQKIKIINNNAS